MSTLSVGNKDYSGKELWNIFGAITVVLID